MKQIKTLLIAAIFILVLQTINKQRKRVDVTSVMPVRLN
jgi:hypothetical protein